ncbi:MAG: aldehyde dehydrogenase [Alphaproteobacteria bacterium]|nr:aldehyde dehydrogenase [Alphaproteobacteria bacterium]
MSSPLFPEPPPAIDPTPVDALDRAAERLTARKQDWATLGIPRRVDYLRRIIDGLMEVAPAWVADGCRNKGIPLGDALAGEEWLTGPVTTVRNARLLLEALEHGGAPKPPALHTRPDGQVVARVFPTNLQDRLMFAGTSAEVRILPGKPATQGRIYRESGGSGAVCLILGAGNVSSIPPMDALHKLFVENEVCLIKMNPVNEWVGPHLERAFRCLIDDGFMAIVYGGIEVGKHLTDHPSVDTLHVTGSDRTYDAIVWGTDPEERARRKAAGDRLNERPFTAELGCVTPVIVVPGQWSEADLDYQARSVAGMVTQNASFNCNAAKVVVTDKAWPQREAFLERLRSVLAGSRPRKAYYPGAEARYSGFLDYYPDAERLGREGDDIVPWTLIPDVPPEAGEYALTNEAFCGVLAETSLEGGSAAAFLNQAVQFANDDCWGTLSCMLIIDPRTEKANKAALERALDELRYGGIAVNGWAGLVYGLCVTTWGAYPGHPPEDIRSGVGVVHNTFLFDHPEKSIVRQPFRQIPPPIWFDSHRSLSLLGQKLLEMEASPGWGRLAGVALAGIKA